MRRKDREIEDKNEVLALLRECPVIRVALCAGGMPYIVPMNYGVSDDGAFIYMHCAGAGKKLDLIAQNDNVCFEADRSFELVKNDRACMWSAKYESVVGTGKISVVKELSEKVCGLSAIMLKYGFQGSPEFSDAEVRSVTVLRIDVGEVTGKRNI